MDVSNPIFNQIKKKISNAYIFLRYRDKKNLHDSVIQMFQVTDAEFD
jgi:hypothetical protein